MIEYLGNNPTQPPMQMVYMLYDEAPVALYSLRKNNIRTIADLAGKSLTGAPFEIHRKLWPVIAGTARRTGCIPARRVRVGGTRATAAGASPLSCPARRASLVKARPYSPSSMLASFLPSGQGQPSPAAVIRDNANCTVERATPTAAAISANERPASNFSRAEKMRGFLKGLNTDVPREDDRG